MRTRIIDFSTISSSHKRFNNFFRIRLFSKIFILFIFLKLLFNHITNIIEFRTYDTDSTYKRHSFYYFIFFTRTIRSININITFGITTFIHIYLSCFFNFLLITLSNYSFQFSICFCDT